MTKYIIGFLVAISAVLGIFWVYYLYVTYYPQNEVVQTAPPPPPTADKILELVNIERAKVGVAPLTSDPRLVASAQAKANDMLTNDYYGHSNPKTGVHGYEYIPHGICRFKSENLDGANSSEEAVNELLASPPHKMAMLSSRYQLIGIAVVQIAPKNTHYVVQHFCQIQ